MVLGSFKTRFPAFARRRKPRGETLGPRSATPSAGIVSAVVALPRWHDNPRGTETRTGAHPQRGGGVVAARSVQRPRALGRYVPRIVWPSAVAVDIPRPREGRAHEQRERTCAAARGHLAETVLRHPESWRQSVRGDD